MAASIKLTDVNGQEITFATKSIGKTKNLQISIQSKGAFNKFVLDANKELTAAEVALEQAKTSREQLNSDDVKDVYTESELQNLINQAEEIIKAAQTRCNGAEQCIKAAGMLSGPHFTVNDSKAAKVLSSKGATIIEESETIKDIEEAIKKQKDEIEVAKEQAKDDQEKVTEELDNPEVNETDKLDGEEGEDIVYATVPETEYKEPEYEVTATCGVVCEPQPEEVVDKKIQFNVKQLDSTVIEGPLYDDIAPKWPEMGRCGTMAGCTEWGVMEKPRYSGYDSSDGIYMQSAKDQYTQERFDAWMKDIASPVYGETENELDAINNRMAVDGQPKLDMKMMQFDDIVAAVLSIRTDYYHNKNQVKMKMLKDLEEPLISGVDEDGKPWSNQFTSEMQVIIRKIGDEFNNINDPKALIECVKNCMNAGNSDGLIGYRDELHKTFVDGSMEGAEDLLSRGLNNIEYKYATETGSTQSTYGDISGSLKYDSDPNSTQSSESQVTEEYQDEKNPEHDSSGEENSTDWGNLDKTMHAETTRLANMNQPVIEQAQEDVYVSKAAQFVKELDVADKQFEMNDSSKAQIAKYLVAAEQIDILEEYNFDWAMYFTDGETTSAQAHFDEYMESMCNEIKMAVETHVSNTVDNLSNFFDYLGMETPAYLKEALTNAVYDGKFENVMTRMVNVQGADTLDQVKLYAELMLTEVVTEFYDEYEVNRSETYEVDGAYTQQSYQSYSATTDETPEENLVEKPEFISENIKPQTNSEDNHHGLYQLEPGVENLNISLTAQSSDAGWENGAGLAFFNENGDPISGVAGFYNIKDNFDQELTYSFGKNEDSPYHIPADARYVGTFFMPNSGPYNRNAKSGDSITFQKVGENWKAFTDDGVQVQTQDNMLHLSNDINQVYIDDKGNQNWKDQELSERVVKRQYDDGVFTIQVNQTYRPDVEWSDNSIDSSDTTMPDVTTMDKENSEIEEPIAEINPTLNPFEPGYKGEVNDQVTNRPEPTRMTGPYDNDYSMSEKPNYDLMYEKGDAPYERYDIKNSIEAGYKVIDNGGEKLIVIQKDGSLVEYWKSESVYDGYPDETGAGWPDYTQSAIEAFKDMIVEQGSAYQAGYDRAFTTLHELGNAIAEHAGISLHQLLDYSMSSLKDDGKFDLNNYDEADHALIGFQILAGQAGVDAVLNYTLQTLEPYTVEVNNLQNAYLDIMQKLVDDSTGESDEINAAKAIINEFIAGVNGSEKLEGYAPLAAVPILFTADALTQVSPGLDMESNKAMLASMIPTSAEGFDLIDVADRIENAEDSLKETMAMVLTQPEHLKGILASAGIIDYDVDDYSIVNPLMVEQDISAPELDESSFWGELPVRYPVDNSDAYGNYDDYDGRAYYGENDDNPPSETVTKPYDIQDALGEGNHIIDNGGDSLIVVDWNGDLTTYPKSNSYNAGEPYVEGQGWATEAKSAIQTFKDMIVEQALEYDEGNLVAFANLAPLGHTLSESAGVSLRDLLNHAMTELEADLGSSFTRANYSDVELTNIGYQIQSGNAGVDALEDYFDSLFSFEQYGLGIQDAIDTVAEKASEGLTPEEISTLGNDVDIESAAESYVLMTAYKEITNTANGEPVDIRQLIDKVLVDINSISQAELIQAISYDNTNAMITEAMYSITSDQDKLISILNGAGIINLDALGAETELYIDNPLMPDAYGEEDYVELFDIASIDGGYQLYQEGNYIGIVHDDYSVALYDKSEITNTASTHWEEDIANLPNADAILFQEVKDSLNSEMERQASEGDTFAPDLEAFNHLANLLFVMSPASPAGAMNAMNKYVIEAYPNNDDTTGKSEAVHFKENIDMVFGDYAGVVFGNMIIESTKLMTDVPNNLSDTLQLYFNQKQILDDGFATTLDLYENELTVKMNDKIAELGSAFQVSDYSAKYEDSSDFVYDNMRYMVEDGKIQQAAMFIESPDLIQKMLAYKLIEQPAADALSSHEEAISLLFDQIVDAAFVPYNSIAEGALHPLDVMLGTLQMANEHALQENAEGQYYDIMNYDASAIDAVVDTYTLEKIHADSDIEAFIAIMDDEIEKALRTRSAELNKGLRVDDDSNTATLLYAKSLVSQEDMYQFLSYTQRAIEFEKDNPSSNPDYEQSSYANLPQKIAEFLLVPPKYGAGFSLDEEGYNATAEQVRELNYFYTVEDSDFRAYFEENDLGSTETSTLEDADFWGELSIPVGVNTVESDDDNAATLYQNDSYSFSSDDATDSGTYYPLGRYYSSETDANDETVDTVHYPKPMEAYDISYENGLLKITLIDAERPDDEQNYDEIEHFNPDVDFLAFSSNNEDPAAAPRYTLKQALDMQMYGADYVAPLLPQDDMYADPAAYTETPVSGYDLPIDHYSFWGYTTLPNGGGEKHIVVTQIKDVDGNELDAVNQIHSTHTYESPDEYIEFSGKMIGIGRALEVVSGDNVNWDTDGYEITHPDQYNMVMSGSPWMPNDMYDSNDATSYETPDIDFITKPPTDIAEPTYDLDEAQSQYSQIKALLNVVDAAAVNIEAVNEPNLEGYEARQQAIDSVNELINNNFEFIGQINTSQGNAMLEIVEGDLAGNVTKLQKLFSTEMNTLLTQYPDLDGVDYDSEKLMHNVGMDDSAENDNEPTMFKVPEEAKAAERPILQTLDVEEPPPVVPIETPEPEPVFIFKDDERPVTPPSAEKRTGRDIEDGITVTLPDYVEKPEVVDTVAMQQTVEEPIDEFIGTAKSDTLQGTDGDDKINGGAGHDTLSGGLGSDTIDGGAGFDLLALQGRLKDYIFEQIPDTDQLKIIDTRNGDIDTVANVEYFRTSDGETHSLDAIHEIAEAQSAIRNELLPVYHIQVNNMSLYDVISELPQDLDNHMTTIESIDLDLYDFVQNVLDYQDNTINELTNSSESDGNVETLFEFLEKVNQDSPDVYLQALHDVDPTGRTSIDMPTQLNELLDLLRMHDIVPPLKVMNSMNDELSESVPLQGLINQMISHIDGADSDKYQDWADHKTDSLQGEIVESMVADMNYEEILGLFDNLSPVQQSMFTELGLTSIDAVLEDINTFSNTGIIGNVIPELFQSAAGRSFINKFVETAIADKNLVPGDDLQSDHSNIKPAFFQLVAATNPIIGLLSDHDSFIDSVESSMSRQGQSLDINSAEGQANLIHHVGTLMHSGDSDAEAFMVEYRELLTEPGTHEAFETFFEQSARVIDHLSSESDDSTVDAGALVDNLATSVFNEINTTLTDGHAPNQAVQDWAAEIQAALHTEEGDLYVTPTEGQTVTDISGVSDGESAIDIESDLGEIKMPTSDDGTPHLFAPSTGGSLSESDVHDFAHGLINDFREYDAAHGNTDASMNLDIALRNLDTADEINQANDYLNALESSTEGHIDVIAALTELGEITKVETVQDYSESMAASTMPITGPLIDDQLYGDQHMI